MRKFGERMSGVGLRHDELFPWGWGSGILDE